jgi:thiosulfate/3-mercaptopyruvate sulfurtransferase
MSDQSSTGPLVDAAWLKAHLRDPDVRVVDLRWYLAGKKGAEEYARGHIPGAVFVDLEHEITAPQGPGRHPIPDGAQFERAMRKAGVSPDTHVVAYDDAGGSIAARLWWLLRYYGHARVSVLDGGLAAWTGAGQPLDATPSAYPEGAFRAQAPARERVVDRAYVDRARSDPRVLVLDARASERYRGDSEPVDARPGHVPGAKSAPWAGNLRDGRYLGAEDLRARYEALGAGRAKEVVVYCGSGVTACHDLIALELAGLPGAKLYEGSWSDWARDPSLPAAKGEE